MAIKGLSIPVVAKYKDNGNGSVTYSDGIVAEKAVTYKISVEATENNPLYADDDICENEKPRFKTGELTLGTSDFTDKMSLLMLGAKTVQRKLTEGTVSETVFDDDMAPAELGFGIIEAHQINNVDKYKAVILTRVYFNIPEVDVTTKGESIEWQTPEITGIISRSAESNENYKHPWKFEAWTDTKEEALKYLKDVLKVSDPGVGVLTALSE